MKSIKDEVRAAMRSDRELKGLTLTQLATKYGVAKSSVSVIVRDCPRADIAYATPQRSIVQAPKFAARPALSKVDIGEAARQMICARLMLAGARVFRPMTEDTPTDLLILTTTGKALKCQCKYVFPSAQGCHCMTLCSTRSAGSKVKAARHMYTADEVDFFLGYCIDNDTVYVIPHAVACVGARYCLHLWVARKCVGKSSKPSFDESAWRNRFDLLL